MEIISKNIAKLDASSTQEFKDLKKQTINSLCSDPIISNFLEKNDLDDQFVEKNIIEFLDMQKYNVGCVGCKGYSFCSKNPKGYLKVIDLNNNKLCYEQCKHFKNLSRVLDKYAIRDFDDAWLTNDFKIILNHPYDKELKANLSNIIINPYEKGIYLYGNAGIGKSFIMSCVTNELLNTSNMKCCFVNFKSFLNDLRTNIKDNNSYTVSQINLLKTIDVLLIDDLGAEKFSDWTITEVLDDILEERLHNGKLTLFTSRFSLEDLQQLYGYRDVKVKRLIDCIKALSKPYGLKNINFYIVK